MKRILWGMALLALCVTTANAALVSRLSGAAYYDNVLNITWLADANAGAGSIYDDGGSSTDGLMSWASAQLWITSLNTANHLGVSDWRLPTTLQPDSSCGSQLNFGSSYPLQGYGSGCTGSEMGHLFNVTGITASSTSPFTNVQTNVYYWSGTTYAPDTSNAWLLDFFYGHQGFNPKSSTGYAWAVRPGDIAAVPIPAAAWFIAPAIGLLAPWVRRRQAAA